MSATCSICGAPTKHYHRRCSEHPVHLFPSPSGRQRSAGRLVPTREEVLFERMLDALTDVLFAPLGDHHGPRVAGEILEDLLADPDRDMAAAIRGALLTAHLEGADHVATARAHELADTCVVAIARADARRRGAGGPGRRRSQWGARMSVDPELLRQARSSVEERRPVCPTCSTRAPQIRTGDEDGPSATWFKPHGHRCPHGEPCPGWSTCSLSSLLGCLECTPPKPGSSRLLGGDSQANPRDDAKAPGSAEEERGDGLPRADAVPGPGAKPASTHTGGSMLARSVSRELPYPELEQVTS